MPAGALVLVGSLQRLPELLADQGADEGSGEQRAAQAEPVPLGGAERFERAFESGLDVGGRVTVPVDGQALGERSVILARDAQHPGRPHADRRVEHDGVLAVGGNPDREGIGAEYRIDSPGDPDPSSGGAMPG